MRPGHTFKSVTEKISRIVLTPHTPLGWFFGFAGGRRRRHACCWSAVTWLFLKGVGIWGLDIPVAWGFAIINFVWWIGIGHAGTLISAILLLFKQTLAQLHQPLCRGHDHLRRRLRRHVPADPRRPSLAGILALPLSQHHERVAAVPLAAVMGRLRGFDVRHHLRGLLVHRHDPRLRHPARPRQVTASASISTACSRSAGAARSRHWMRYETASLLLAGLATPLVLSVHTVISFDFAVAVLPGWHTTIFPPYFVAGAIYSGFAMVHHAGHSDPQVLPPRRPDHRCATSTTWAR